MSPFPSGSPHNQHFPKADQFLAAAFCHFPRFKSLAKTSTATATATPKLQEEEDREAREDGEAKAEHGALRAESNCRPIGSCTWENSAQPYKAYLHSPITKADSTCFGLF